MRFAKMKSSQPGSGHSDGDSPTPCSPSHQHRQSYLQRMYSQVASLRVSYTSRRSTKVDNSTTNDALKKERDAIHHNELDSIDEDVVYRLGSTDSDNPPARAQPQVRRVLWWGDAKSRLYQTTTMLRDACATKSSALLSSAWRVYPGSKHWNGRHRISSSSSSGGETPPPKRSAKEQQCEQWLRTAGRESEISICMSYYSPRSFSDAATDCDEHQQQLFLTTTTWRRRTSSGESSSSREKEDPFRRRCSSVDSYVSNERGSSGAVRDDDADFGEETIRESLFLRSGKLYAIRNEWF